MFHSIDICQEIAQRMKDPRRVHNEVTDSISRGTFSEAAWTQLSLIEGMPGIACFYACMDRLFPDEGWDTVSLSYLKIITESFQNQGHSDNSLFTGLGGICYATYLCSKNSSRYINLQSKLDSALIDEVHQAFLREGKNYLNSNTPLPPKLYNLSSGISGILAYLLLRKDNHVLYRLAADCTSLLVQLLSRKLTIDGETVPGWYVLPKDQLAKEEAEKYPQGSYILGMTYGITGCLSALSLAAKEGLRVDGLTEIITEIAEWLKNQHLTIDGKISWQHTIPVQKTDTSSDLSRDTWWYGIPAVARSLYLASKVTRDESLSQFAEQTYLSMFSKEMKEWNMMATSFVHGRAGVLATTFRMAEDTKNPLLWKQVSLLEQDLKSFYKPDSTFGFRMVMVDPPDHYRWVDHPGLFTGASGVALSLLLVQQKESLEWDRAFLIN